MANSTQFGLKKQPFSKQHKWRKRQDLQKSNQDSDDSDSSSDVEDDDAEGLTPQIEKDFFKTLSFVKSKDPRIYDKQSKFYQSEESSSETEGVFSTVQKKKKESKEKAMYLKDYERKIILEKGGQYSEDESNEDGDSDEDRQKRFPSPSYVEEQKQIQESFHAALDSDGSDSKEMALLTKKTKSKEEKEEEENDYKTWLLGKTDEPVEGKEMTALRNYWVDPNLDEGELFLRNYIINKEYISKEDHKKNSSEEESDDDDEEVGFSEEERLLDEQDNFERKFNFRYEEPDAEFIKRYPRTLAGSVRRKDSSRTVKREKRKDRKEQEKKSKTVELKRLKNIKKQEILDKLDQLKKATGNAKVGFDPDDLEGDFDPEKHEQIMQNIFNEEYDTQEDGGIKPDLGDELDDNNFGEWDEEYGDGNDYGEEEGAYEEEGYKPHCDDPNFIMDAEYDPSSFKKAKKEKESSTKKWKSAGFADNVNTDRPIFDPVENSFDEYMDDYYKLDYEDLIGDLPCRFKYRCVVPNDFGLSVEEVLSAQDKELNQWVSIKKTSQYRTKEEEIYDIKMFRKRSRNTLLKQKIFQSLMEEQDEDSNEDTMRESQKEFEEKTCTSNVAFTSSARDMKKKQRKRKLKDDYGDDECLQVKRNNTEESGSLTVSVKGKKNSALLETEELEEANQNVDRDDTIVADDRKQESKLSKGSKKRHRSVGKKEFTKNGKLFDKNVEGLQDEGLQDEDLQGRRKVTEESINQTVPIKRKKSELLETEKTRRANQDIDQDDPHVADHRKQESKFKKGKKKHRTVDKKDFTRTDKPLDNNVEERLRTVNVQSVPLKESSKADKLVSANKNKHTDVVSEPTVSGDGHIIHTFPNQHVAPSNLANILRKKSKYKKGPMWSSDSKSHQSSQKKVYGSSDNQTTQKKSKYKKVSVWSSGKLPTQSKVYGSRSHNNQRLFKTNQGAESVHQHQQITNKQTIESHSNPTAGRLFSGKRMKHKTRKGPNNDPLSSISDARLKAYGINPKKIKFQLEYQQQKQINRS